MRNLNASSIAVFALLVAAGAAGCRDKYEMSSPACVDLEKTKDPAARAELEKKCIRGSQKFEPSPVKKW